MLHSVGKKGGLERDGGKRKVKISHLLAYIASNFIELKNTKREIRIQDENYKQTKY